MNTPWPPEAQDRSYEQSTIPNSIASLLSLEVCTRVSVFAWFFLALVLTWAPRVSSIAPRACVAHEAAWDPQRLGEPFGRRRAVWGVVYIVVYIWVGG